MQISRCTPARSAQPWGIGTGRAASAAGPAALGWAGCFDCFFCFCAGCFDCCGADRFGWASVRLGLVLAEIGEKAGVQITDDELQRALFEQIRRVPQHQQQ